MQKIQPFIKSEKVEYNTTHRFDFTNLNDLIFTDVVSSIFIEELLNFKKSIDTFRDTCIKFGKDGINNQLYIEKRNLVRDYIKCVNNEDKSALNKKLVKKYF
jgi:hypothetical protein